MVTIPLYIFLFAFFFFLLFFAVFFVINLSHIFHTGTFTLATFAATTIFLIFSFLVLWYSFLLVQATDWQQPVTIWNNAWFSFNSTFLQ